MVVISPVLRQLARTFRYRFLPELVGRAISVESLTEVEPELRSLVSGAGFVASTWWANNFAAAVAKYDLIDVGFSTTAAALDHAQSRRGLRALQEFGFLQDEASAEDDLDMDTTCLDSLVKDIAEGTTWIRLFLVARPARDPDLPEHRRQMVSMRLPADYFPHTFVVADAAITNAQSIWVQKHLWM